MISSTGDKGQNDWPKAAWSNCHSYYCQVLLQRCCNAQKKEAWLYFVYFNWLFQNMVLIILIGAFLSFPTAEEWSFASPALGCAASGDLQSSRGQEPSSEAQHWDPESPKCQAEVAGESSVRAWDRCLFVRDRAGSVTCGKLSPVPSSIFIWCSCPFLSAVGFWIFWIVIFFFFFNSPSSCWFKSVMSHVSCALCS